MSAVVKIARCEVHGLHGERERCYVCDRPCEQVEMMEATAVVDTLETLVEALQRGVEALEKGPPSIDPVRPLVLRQMSDALERSRQLVATLAGKSAS